MDVFIKRSDFTGQSDARTIPLAALFAEFADPQINDTIAVARHQHAIGLGGEFDEPPAIVRFVGHFSVSAHAARKAGIVGRRKARTSSNITPPA
ncbi:hypothetical protein [Bradyrhizobium sp. Ash2021]|uniref:hypothetical protein n=1 Tax=Bradyrhizobium sp. Ash2021 TaxID=2954771 RepID=UPI0028151268|nr:hypothetical protein [Bradyrhizobium sp. Ash2021]WMT74701.1 hypothetical protein NL528_43760 [Bradyrhizobium sp. Ash2021]